MGVRYRLVVNRPGYNTRDALRDYFEIVITDSGIGIDRNKIERIFERFYQIDNDVTKSNFGTGIGLHLSRSLVQLHHGIIFAENRKMLPEAASSYVYRWVRHTCVPMNWKLWMRILLCFTQSINLF